MSWPCIAGYCVDWNVVEDVAETAAAIALAPLAILGGCATTQPLKETDWDSITGYPDEFVSSWNSMASDSVITPNEFATLKKMALQTADDQDDIFIDALESLTTQRSSEDFNSAMGAMLELHHLKNSAARFGMNIGDIQIKISDSPSNKRIINTGPINQHMVTGSITIDITE